MRISVLIIIVATIFFSCDRGDAAPDVSSVKVTLETKRFEQDFFKIDTLRVSEAIGELIKKYPGFTADFIHNILGLSLDSVLSGNQQHQSALKLFVHDYMAIKDSADKKYKDFKDESADIRKTLQYVKYYFPDYKLPSSIITFIGPMDAFFQTSLGIQGDVLTEEGVGVGLQLHLGADFSFYHSSIGQSLYPEYVSANFDEKHIVVNVAKTIADDLFDDRSVGRPLVELMVEKGKFLYLISRFVPHVEDYVLMGYSAGQMKEVYKNEGVIWSFFLSNDLLNTQEQDIIKNYVGEGPKTQEFGDNAPGNLGSFAGWQIVKKFMEKYPETSLDGLMRSDPREIYTRSKYKPRS